MSDIHIGDMLYDCEAEGNLFGMVTNECYQEGWWKVEWNDGNSLTLYSDKVRGLKKEYHKLRKKCLTRKKK